MRAEEASSSGGASSSSSSGGPSYRTRRREKIFCSELVIKASAEIMSWPPLALKGLARVCMIVVDAQ